MLEFAWPLAALALALPLAVRLLPAAPPIGAPLRVPFLAAAREWQSAARARPRVRAALALAAYALLVAAACRPQWAGEPVGVPSSGRSMLLALDVSGSMRVAALGPEIGLNVMRRTARQFVAARQGDRVGLIVFGTKAYVQSPLTFDLHAIDEMIDETFIGLAGEGTALGDAIALAVSRLRAMQADERVLVLLTDGSNTDGLMSVPDAARLARHHGVRVHAIGIGDPEQQLRPGEGLDEPALKDVAETTGGQYFRASDAQALERVYAALEVHEPAAHEARRYRPVRELYALPLALAFVLAAAALLPALREARA